MKHKHCDLIVAWANGAQIQYIDGSGAWCDCFKNEPCWVEEDEYRIKPEPPAKVYPETRMTNAELEKSVSCCVHELRGAANAALRHAIDSGQVYTPQDVYDMKKELMRGSRAARDMEIAEAVLNAILAKEASNSWLIAYRPDLPAIIATVKD